ncbi:hypothetical protein FDECE_10427 [Fusarium decemcellulare]|nr:hypothetical protein FDECE_10427 [Fusarium decemcellulare]
MPLLTSNERSRSTRGCKESRVDESSTQTSSKDPTPNPDLHHGWGTSIVAMSKCDFCQQGARGTLQQCHECRIAICKGCFEQGQLDSRHQLDSATVNWEQHLNKTRPKKNKGKRGRTSNVVDLTASPALREGQLTGTNISLDTIIAEGVRKGSASVHSRHREVESEAVKSTRQVEHNNPLSSNPRNSHQGLPASGQSHAVSSSRHPLKDVVQDRVLRGLRASGLKPTHELHQRDPTPLKPAITPSVARQTEGLRIPHINASTFSARTSSSQERQAKRTEPSNASHEAMVPGHPNKRQKTQPVRHEEVTPRFKPVLWLAPEPRPQAATDLPLPIMEPSLRIGLSLRFEDYVRLKPRLAAPSRQPVSTCEAFQAHVHHARQPNLHRRSQNDNQPTSPIVTLSNLLEAGTSFNQNHHQTNIGVSLRDEVRRMWDLRDSPGSILSSQVVASSCADGTTQQFQLLVDATSIIMTRLGLQKERHPAREFLETLEQQLVRDGAMRAL